MRRLIVLLYALLLPTASLASTPAESATYSINARVTVSKTGVVGDFSLAPRYQAIEATVAEVVRRWRFNPARLDGVPVALETTMFLKLDTRPDGQGGLLAEVSMTGNGACSVHMTSPRYPISALRDGASGIVRLEVAYDTDGKVVGTRVLQSAATRKQYRAAFDLAAKAAARDWQFRPERANGVGMAGVAIVPIKFKVSGTKLPELPPSPELEGLAGDPDELLSRSAHPLTRVDAEG